MDKILTYGEPENVKQINDTGRELEVVTSKLKKLKEKKNQLEEFKQAQDEQLKGLDDKLAKVMKLA